MKLFMEKSIDLNVEVNIVPGGKMPVKGSENAACYDVYARKIEKRSDGLVKCYLGIKTSIPNNYKGIVIARSNLTKYDFVLNNGIGIIDPDDRNEWQARFRPINKASIIDFPYKEGDRVAQISFEKINTVEFISVKEHELENTKRGTGGFGSTGVK